MLNAVSTNIEQRKNLKNEKAAETGTVANFSDISGNIDKTYLSPEKNFQSGGPGRNRSRFESIRGQGRSLQDHGWVFHYRRKPAHFIKVCGTRIANEEGGQINKSHSNH